MSMRLLSLGRVGGSSTRALAIGLALAATFATGFSARAATLTRSQRHALEEQAEAVRKFESRQERLQDKQEHEVSSLLHQDFSLLKHRPQAELIDAPYGRKLASMNGLVPNIPLSLFLKAAFQHQIPGFHHVDAIQPSSQSQSQQVFTPPSGAPSGTVAAQSITPSSMQSAARWNPGQSAPPIAMVPMAGQSAASWNSAFPAGSLTPSGAAHLAALNGSSQPVASGLGAVNASAEMIASASVPEPSTWLCAGLLTAFGAWTRRRVARRPVRSATS